MSRLSLVMLLSAAALAACYPGRPQAPNAPEIASSKYLFVWAGDADRRESDFLAVVDIDRQSPTYTDVVATLPVGAVGTVAHHTEHEMSPGAALWANGFAAGQTFRFDLRDPRSPRLAGTFGSAGAFSHPHSYVRLANGNVLSTFQHGAHGGGLLTGGLVELDSAGRVVRSASAAVAVDTAIRPYSLAVVQALDRVVTTSTDMHLGVRSSSVQLWRLSDLALLHTIALPPGPRGDEHWLTAEPRVLEDGRTVLVNTFTCGLYRLRGLESEAPSAEWIHSTPYVERQFCALPVVTGRFWLQTSGTEYAVVSLDVADPDRPREVSRLALPSNHIPHWIALEPNAQRLVITGYRDLQHWVLLAELDRETGRLTLDTTFAVRGSGRPGVSFGRATWPHGSTGPAVPHGAVFSRP